MIFCKPWPQLCPRDKRAAEKDALTCPALPDLRHVVVMGGGPAGTLSWDEVRDLGRARHATGN